jgi:hypothetical protein
MMTAGKYYLGDLCYVMHGEWDEFCDLTIQGNSLLNGEFNLKDGRRFATFTTKWGDGVYQDEQGRSYSVDAGLIGCIRVEDIDFTDASNNVSGGQIVEFDRDFTTFSSGGVIRFGDVVIDTDAEEEMDYE